LPASTYTFLRVLISLIGIGSGSVVNSVRLWDARTMREKGQR
jgi:hypothetical protein